MYNKDNCSKQQKKLFLKTISFIKVNKNTIQLTGTHCSVQRSFSLTKLEVFEHQCPV